MLTTVSEEYQTKSNKRMCNMKIEQLKWDTANDYDVFACNSGFSRADLVMVFGSRELLSNDEYVDSVRNKYPSAQVIGCTTSGEILGAQVFDNSFTTTAIEFDATRIESACVGLKDPELSYEAGLELAKALDKEDLAHIFVISEGLNVNGSRLVTGLKSGLTGNVSVTGGLAGDGILFNKTMTIANGHAKENIVAAIGFYGDKIKIGFGSIGGWDSFGIERLITKSKDNILYEMDGKPVLDLYTDYLGEYAKDLPASGLLFPLSIRSKDSNEGLVRTILGVNMTDKSMTFAGDVPEGFYAKLMKANIDLLVNGAIESAELSINNMDSPPSLAVLISCVGRKLIFNQRVEEEVEAVRDVLGEDCMLTGFYSYGEICPYTQISNQNGIKVYKHIPGAELHNQTMTITTFTEV